MREALLLRQCFVYSPLLCTCSCTAVSGCLYPYLYLCNSAPVGRSGRRSSAPVSHNSSTPSKCTSKTASTTTSTTTSKAGVRAFAVWLCLWRFLLQHMDLHEDKTTPCSSTRRHSQGTNLTPSSQSMTPQQVNRRTAWAG